jgi:hypothetical protein
LYDWTHTPPGALVLVMTSRDASLAAAVMPDTV